MVIRIDKDSHVDHGLTKAHLELITSSRFDQHEALFVETITLPEELSSLSSGLYGPLAGDLPVPEDECDTVIRMGRPWPTRVTHKPVRPTRKMTVVAGPGDDPEDKNLVLYTAYGGPAAPREPGDFGLSLHCKVHAPLYKAMVSRTYTTEEGDQVELSDILLGRIEKSMTCADCAAVRRETAKSVAFWREHAISINDCQLVKNSDLPEVRDRRAKAHLLLSAMRPGERLQFTCDTCTDNDHCRYAFSPTCVEGVCTFFSDKRGD